MKKLVLLFILFEIFSCKHRDLTTSNYPSFIDPSKDNDWGGDVRLSIVSREKSDKYILYTLRSIYNNDTLGFQLLRPFREDKSGFGSGLEIRSLGKISKNFKNALARLYKVKVDTASDFPRKISLSFVDLDKFTRSTVGEPTDKDGFDDYKLFFEDSKDSDDGKQKFSLILMKRTELYNCVKRTKIT